MGGGLFCCLVARMKVVCVDVTTLGYQGGVDLASHFPHIVVSPQLGDMSPLRPDSESPCPEKAVPVSDTHEETSGRQPNKVEKGAIYQQPSFQRN